MAEEGENKNPHRVFELLFLISQIIIIILYALCTDYGDGVHPAMTTEESANAADVVQTYYPMF